ncbi:MULTISPECIES: DUF6692 family protein [Pseudomonadaceae]|jgi:hypothetical protein|uniref:Uncharacterized protein n=1 Tax=Stutzerimonas chloritidismutans TaxID=203192 RepID=A0ACC5VH61_STUCH|nr:MULTISPECIES: DUF6692 family protein [Stutzerimonas stutzeri subgroup]MBX7271808.1 hypothetical protein [Stutzerimonas chloritidismutans]MCQ4288237.1 hypothetical protein [Stutzerimonas stutzeri]MCQ4311137.1 hypothetical protein [Stutzerimonas stutzeri]|tara:strand:+ start:984 stop:1559 length:576 start_codon:yes stop_codon:yes gene_type:complete
MQLYRAPAIARAILPKTIMTTFALALTACGDPAPGEGLDKPTMRPPLPEVVSARDAIGSPDIPSIDPQTLDQAEVDKVLGSGPYCTFVYTAESPPVVAIKHDGESGGAKGVIKIHGKLVQLSSEPTQGYSALFGGASLAAESINVNVALGKDGAVQKPTGEKSIADLNFELDQGLMIGYRGWYACEKPPRS